MAISERRSGILLHPTSIDAPFGIGDLGPALDRWLEWMEASRTRLWQILPLGPTGYGDSPYQCFSAFAGNPLLVSPELLIADGLLTADEVERRPSGPVDYGTVVGDRNRLLDVAAERYAPDAAFEAFRRAQSQWLHDYALFMAIKESQGLAPWTEWPADLRDRDDAALSDAAERLASRVHAHEVRQFLFFHQWERVRARATAAGISIIGDAPIFVAHDSADVWTNRHLFTVDDTGRLELMAGVPPDYFSPTGQLWGNPLYRWERHAAENYAWWKSRLSAVFSMVDVVRIDHFRAFADYWAIPAGAPTAETGEWLDGPGDAFFQAMTDHFGDLPIIAEDLGELSPAVEELRDRWGLPGMKILQFAFDGDPNNPFLPDHYPENCVAYTGTHDNETVAGWFSNASDEERARALALVGGDGSDIAWRMLSTVWHSRAAWAIGPLQDFLGLGDEGRMNTPGVAAGNWRWRYRESDLTPELGARIGSLNDAAGR